jgi:hypothetical protein
MRKMARRWGDEGKVIALARRRQCDDLEERVLMQRRRCNNDSAKATVSGGANAPIRWRRLEQDFDSRE